MDTCRDKNIDNEFNLKCGDVSDIEATDCDEVCTNKTDICCNGSNTTKMKATTEFLVQYRGRGYDINNFLNNHPGGRNTLARFKDQLLDGILAKQPHSKSAYYLLEEFAVQRQERYNECEVSYLYTRENRQNILFARSEKKAMLKYLFNKFLQSLNNERD